MAIRSRYFERLGRRELAWPEDPGEVLAYGYIRVSSKAQDGRTSPESQRYEIAHYVDKRRWTLRHIFKDVKRGWRPDRPDYLKLRAEVEYQRRQGRVVVAVAVDFDRTGRIAEEMLAFGRELDELLVPLHLVSENGALTANMRLKKAVEAEEETARLSARVSRARRATVRAGLPLSGPAGWGYRWRMPVDQEEARRHRLGTSKEIKQVLDVHEDEAPHVREAFARVEAGAGTGQLAAWVAGLPPAARGGRNLNQAALTAVLRNPLYVARRVHPQVLAEEGVPHETAEDLLALPQSPHWPALVDDATWLAVQQRLGDPKRTRRGRPPQRLLTGLLRCENPACGAPMAGGGGYVGGRYREQYRCEGWSLGAGKAHLRCYYTVPQPKVEAPVLARVGAVVEAVLRRRGDPAFLAALERAFDRLRYPEAGALDASAREVARLQGQLAAVKNGLAKGLAEKLVRLGAAAPEEAEQIEEEYEGARERLREQRRALEAELAGLGVTDGAANEPDVPPVPPLDEVLARLGGWARALADMDVPAQRLVLGVLLERIVPERVGYGRYEVHLSGPVYETLARLADVGGVGEHRGSRRVGA